MNKAQLELLKTKQAKLEILNIELKGKKQEFEQSNAGLIEEINQLENSFNQTKEEIKLEAIEEFSKTSQKKLLGGIGIRVTSKLFYNEKEAINWAKTNMPVAIVENIDKKQFESFAKTNDLNFVEKQETIGVTFPKQIII